MRNLISISEMAKLHGLTRQTLIYYDEIDLFKPVQVDDNGYRYYSRRQIPFLREICFLKNLGIGLKEIVAHFQARDPQKEMALLKNQKDKLTLEIAQLNKKRDAINQRISIYEEAVDADALQIHEPFIKPCQARKALFKEYVQPINRENLHLTLMSLWQEIFKKENVPSGGFGSILKQKSILSGDFLLGAGSCVFVPPWSEDHANIVTLPAGLYACMYKYGMPYETDQAKLLWEWIQANGYELMGDIVDVCLLDTTFYKEQKTVDFCLLQALVRPK
jgi:DNA-binding transcriptional MerR regulator